MRRTKHEEKPASNVVQMLGGCRSVGRALEINPSTVSRWQTAYDLGGTGGRIPQKHWQSLLSIARRRGVLLSVTDLAGSVE